MSLTAIKRPPQTLPNSSDWHKWNSRPFGGPCVTRTSMPSGISFHLSQTAVPDDKWNAQPSKSECLHISRISNTEDRLLNYFILKFYLIMNTQITTNAWLNIKGSTQKQKSSAINETKRCHNEILLKFWFWDASQPYTKEQSWTLVWSWYVIMPYLHLVALATTATDWRSQVRKIWEHWSLGVVSGFDP